MKYENMQLDFRKKAYNTVCNDGEKLDQVKEMLEKKSIKFKQIGG